MTTYRFTCTYCGHTWELTYKYANPQCGSCKDKNIQCEKIVKKDYYGNEEETKDDDNNQHGYWRD